MNDPAFHPLHEAFPTVARWLTLESAPNPVSTSVDRLVALFGLGVFERNILLLAAFAALEAEAGDHISRVNKDSERRQPTVATLLTCVPGANWSALAANGGLRRHRLITFIATPAFAGQQIVLPESVLFYLLGAPALSPSVADFVTLQTQPPLLSPSRDALVQKLCDALRTDAPVITLLTGTDAEGKLQAMTAACAQRGEKLCLLHASMLPGAVDDLLQFARELQRDVTLLGGRLLLRIDAPGEEVAVRHLVQALSIPVAIACDEPLVFPGKSATRVEMPRMRASQQAQVWRDYLGEDRPGIDGAIAALANNFRVTPELAETVRAALDTDAETGTEHLPLDQRVWATCRDSVRPRMNELAERIESTAQWDDLVLPAREKDLLRRLTEQAGQRSRVYEEWGFGDKLQERGLGISALLSGPSGTGKTMAGQVIANALGLDLYRIDLSSVVSKWLGETEKNIRRLFDAAEEGGVVMQFDEADALFGKRSEVKDSHDRHANIEVSYLLQKLESYRGIAILTTNLKDNIDQAFMRRIRFIVDFPFPGIAERERIWRRIFPADVPLGQLDFGQLAQLNVAGGTIRNIALSGAFRAASDGAPVTMARIAAAAQCEYDKVGRMMTDKEIAGWDR